MKYHKSCKNFLLIAIIILCLLHYFLYYFSIINLYALTSGTFIFSLLLMNKYFGKISVDQDVIKIEYLFTTALFPNDIKELVKIDELSSIEIKKVFGFKMIYLKYKTGKTCLLTPKCQSNSFLEEVNQTLS